MSRPELARNQRKAVIFGATGQLGTAVLENFRASGHYLEILTPRWKDHEPQLGNAGLLETALSGKTGALDVVIASGLTDPQATSQALLKANFEFPSQLIQAVLRDSRFTGTRIITLGSIHETFAELAQKNSYLASKLRFARWLESFGAEAQSRVLHLRLHTLYGGRPQPRMFLGQMIEALRSHREFKMSSGEQLREYMHVDDFAHAVDAIFSEEWDFGNVLELNSGDAIKLSDLARAVFEAAGAPELLKVGAISAAGGENRDRIFKKTSERFLPQHRPALPNIIAWVLSRIGATAQ